MSAELAERKLAAILAADVAGYSRLMSEDEVGTLAALKSHIRELLDPAIARHRGRIVKTTGDGLLAEFSSAVRAVECAVEIQHEMVRRGAEVPAGRRLEFRIGLNVGDVIVQDDDVFGDAVNVAARLEALAESGGICLSGATYLQVRDRLALSFVDLGERSLKNMPEPVHVYRVDLEAPAQPRQRAPAFEPREGPTIAVLPFDNLSGDPQQGYFSDGITNDIITELSKFPQLVVIASHSAFTYKGRSVKVQEVGRDLGARYVLEGSVQRIDNRIRINAQLIEAATDKHLWAERYDRESGDLFAIQDEITLAIVSTLVARVDTSERQRAQRKPTESLQAYDHYRRGREVYFHWTRESNSRAREHFAKAIELDPNFARAYGYLSFTVLQSYMNGWTDRPEAALQEAYALAQKALALDPNDYDNLWSLGAVCIYRREFDRGLAFYERALELNPNDANLLVEMAEKLIYAGRIGEALAKIERAKRLNPRYPDWYEWVLGMALYHDGRYPEALAALTRIGSPPNLSRLHLAATYVRLGRPDEAKSVVDEFRRREPAGVALETLWPYRDPAVWRAFAEDLRSAGLTI
jgi:adenylate cyclase